MIVTIRNINDTLRFGQLTKDLERSIANCFENTLRNMYICHIKIFKKTEGAQTSAKQPQFRKYLGKTFKKLRELSFSSRFNRIHFFPPSGMFERSKLRSCIANRKYLRCPETYSASFTLMFRSFGFLFVSFLPLKMYYTFVIKKQLSCFCELYGSQLGRLRVLFIILITNTALQRWCSDSSVRSMKLFHLSFIV